MRALSAVVLGAAVLLAGSACGNGRRQASNRTSSSTISRSARMLSGRVECTASTKTPVQKRHELRVVFRFHNISKRPVEVDLSFFGPWFRVSNRYGTPFDGKQAQDQAGRGPIPPYSFTRIAPGKTATTSRSTWVRWKGPLFVNPACGNSTGVLPALQVAVESAG